MERLWIRADMFYRTRRQSFPESMCQIRCPSHRLLIETIWSLADNHNTRPLFSLDPTLRQLIRIPSCCIHDRNYLPHLLFPLRVYMGRIMTDNNLFGFHQLALAPSPQVQRVEHTWEALLNDSSNNWKKRSNHCRGCYPGTSFHPPEYHALNSKAPNRHLQSSMRTSKRVRASEWVKRMK